MSCSRGGRDTGVVVVTREEEATELGLGTMIPVYGAGKMFFRIDCWWYLWLLLPKRELRNASKRNQIVYMFRFT